MERKDVRREMQSSVKKQYYAAIVVNIICFCHGCTIGWVSPSIPVLMGPESPFGVPLTDTESYLVASVVCIAGTICTPIFGWIADRFGRRFGLLLSALPYLVSWVLKLVWYSPTGLILARFIAGIGAAGILMLSPLYCVEIASLEVKGTLGSFMILTINTGIVFVYVIGAYTSYMTTLAIMIPLPLVFLLLMYYLPESPSFLVKTGDFQAAEKSLSWLRNAPIDGGIVRKEMEFLKGYKSTVEGQEQSAWNAFRSSPPTIKAFFIIMLLFTLQVFMGMFAVVSFSQDIFQSAGTNIAPSTCSIIVGSLMLFGSLLGTALIERLGRKLLLMGSCLIVAISMVIMGSFFHARDSGIDVETYKMVPIFALSVVVCTFSVGAGPIPYILPSEIFILQIRGAATGIALSWVWFLSFVVAAAFGPAAKLIGFSGVFYFFGATSIMAVFVVMFFIPETKGKTVEESMAFYDKTKSSFGRSSTYGQS